MICLSLLLMMRHLSFIPSYCVIYSGTAFSSISVFQVLTLSHNNTVVIIVNNFVKVLQIFICYLGLSWKNKPMKL